MTRPEYQRIMDIIDKLCWIEDGYAAAHCELNRDNKEEVRRRRNDQERYKRALEHVRMEIKRTFKDGEGLK